MSVNRSILLLSIIFIVGFGTQESFATNPEFVTVLPQTSASLQAASSDIDVMQVSINTDVLAAEKINLSVFGETIEITHNQTIFRNSTDYTFVGSTPGLDKNVFITVIGDMARLEMSIAGENYVLMPNGNAHEISNFSNTASTIGDNPIEGQANPDWRNIIDSLPAIPPNSNTHGNVEIDVIFLYTEAAWDSQIFDNDPNNAYTILQIMANLGIDKANIAFQTSDIPIELVNVEIDGVGTNHQDQGGGDYIEGDIFEDLERLTVKFDGYMERGNAVRDNENADIGVLFVDIPNGPLCGVAPYILGDEEHAFVAVNVDCAGEFMGNIIAHEIGHVMGARHQYDAGIDSDPNTIPFEFGHAFKDESAGQQTLMVSSFFSCADCTNYVMWSDPDENIFGTTDPAGDEQYRNNARVMALTGAYVASFRGGTETNVLIDNEKPIITLNGITSPLEVGVDTYTELGATVSDNDPAYSGTVTVGGDTVNTNIVGSYTVTYTAPADASGNIPIAVNRIVIVQDTILPVITLIGANPQTIELGDGYTELGATTDDDSLVTIDDSAFVDAVYTYSIFYDATDAAGNAATQVIRTVDVVDTIPPRIDTISRQDPLAETTNESTLTFRVTFDKDVTGVDQNDFTTNGTATSSVTGFTANTATRYDMVATVTGSGTVSIELKSSEHGIQDQASTPNALTNTTSLTTAQTYIVTLDTVPDAPTNTSADVGDFIASFDGTDKGSIEFNTPVAVAVDSNDRIIVGDVNLELVQIYTSNGDFITSFNGYTTNGGIAFDAPMGVAVDSNDNIIVVDTALDLVQIFEGFTSDIVYQLSFGSSG